MATRFYIDLDTSPCRVLPRPTSPAAAAPWRAKRGDASAAEFYFVSNGLITDVPTETLSSISFQAKFSGTASTYRTDPLLLGTVTVGTDALSRKFWNIVPDWGGASAALAELLAPNYGPDPVQISLPAELAWEDGSGNQTSTDQIDFIVINDVVQALADTVLT